MKFEIKFDEIIFRRQNDFLFKDEWKDYLNAIKKNLFYAIISLVFSLFLVYNEKYFGYLVFVFFLIFSIDYYKSRKFYMEVKKKFYENINTTIIQQRETNEKSVWIFKDEYFFNGFNGFEGKYNWQKFESFKVINDMCIVYINSENKELGFVLSKEEVGVKDFNFIVDFLDKKLTNLNII